MIVRANQGDTVDSICWRYFGRTQGLVEQVLELNPGLADQGPVLVHGTAVTLPDQIEQAGATVKETIKLWD
ncbi:phage tail protein [Alcaligenaceae bacterium SJ-26]|nr:phage tail protein [Alcaligenaceae bacterium SJ-26]